MRTSSILADDTEWPNRLLRLVSLYERLRHGFLCMTSFDIDYFCSFIQQCDGRTQGSPSRARAIRPLQVWPFSCLYEKSWLCDDYAEGHECGEEMLLPPLTLRGKKKKRRNR